VGDEWHQAWWVEGTICLDSWNQGQENGEQPYTPHGDRANERRMSWPSLVGVQGTLGGDRNLVELTWSCLIQST
jgi:hypothetical protein